LEHVKRFVSKTEDGNLGVGLDMLLSLANDYRMVKDDRCECDEEGLCFWCRMRKTLDGLDEEE